MKGMMNAGRAGRLSLRDRAACLWLAGCLPLCGMVVDSSVLAPNALSGSSSDGRIQLRGSGPLAVAQGFFGIAGGVNSQALDDADGMPPADEWMEFSFDSDIGLESLEVTWTRAVVTISGFAADPGGAGGSYDAAAGVWQLSQSWTGSNRVVLRFSNAAASTGRTLRLAALDPAQPGPQMAVVAVRAALREPDSGGVPLVPDAREPGQEIDHFGASMYWTIDPTEAWPEPAKERLALLLASRAGGIGLSGLRFDFGGGEPGTGVQTSEPWSWRFPRPMKDGVDAPMDFRRRAGQQWFLRRADALGVERMTLGSNSPPWWMTRNGRTFCSPQVGASNLDPARVGDYARHLAEIAEHFHKNEGISFHHISPVNEPEWAWEDGSQEGCRYRAEDIRPLAVALEAELAARGMAGVSRVQLGEHGMIHSLLDNADLSQIGLASPWNGGNNAAGYGKYREYLKDLHGHVDVAGKVDAVASYHSYFTDDTGSAGLGGGLRARLAASAAARGLGVFQSEYCILGSYGPGRNLQMDPARHVFRVLHADLAIAGSKGWCWWLALSPHDYKDGLVYTDFDRVGKTNPGLYPSKIHWALGHFSRFVRPGWRRIRLDQPGDWNGLMATAWLAPDHSEVVIVAGNFASESMTVVLPEQVAGVTGTIREWQPWVTDRGRNLAPGPAARRQGVLPPHSITTWVARPSSSRFRLRAGISAENLPAGEVLLRGWMTSEDGRYRLKGLPGEWVFEPETREPRGSLWDGSYYIRRNGDGAYLTSDAVSTTRDGQALWRAERKHGGWIFRHAASGKWLGPDGRVRDWPQDPQIPEAVAMNAEHEWLDQLGTAEQVVLRPQVDRMVELRIRNEEGLATHRIEARSAAAASHQVAVFPAFAAIRPGQSVALRAVARDGARPWRFRLVSQGRDEVIRSAGVAAAETALPTGDAREWWEWVDPADGRILPGLELGRDLWLRSGSSGLCLMPAADGSTAGTVLVTGVPTGPGATWRAEADGSGPALRIRHGMSGLVLNLSGGGGAPILWPDAGAGNDRFHFDSQGLEPLELEWSHDDSRGAEIQVTPDDGMSVAVRATRGGRDVEAIAEIRVMRTYEEWLSWRGIPAGQAGDSAMLAYALGGQPWQPAAAVMRGREVVWPKNPQAIGMWEVQSSRDLRDWKDEAAGDFQVLEDSAERLRVEATQAGPRLFLRLLFTPGQP